MGQDYSEIKNIIELHGAGQIQKYLQAGWVVLAVAEGKDEYGAPYVKYSLGHTDDAAPRNFY